MSAISEIAPDPGQMPPLRVAMLVYPMMTLLDLAGPQAALGMHGETYLVWKDREPVPTDSGVTIIPTHSFDDCPRDIDVLFAPGGFGTDSWMEDDAVIDFLADAGKTAKYVTSVCSGSLLLAAAGLLDGYRAGTHWAARDALATLGVEVSDERVVTDRNRMTGGGVTAGIDFGLTLLAELRGEMVAKSTTLAMEYNPYPPFKGGTPATADPEILQALSGMMTEMDDRVLNTAKRVADKRAG
ncbi:DJ-1/PfpI family protein [Parasphingopyxis sp.]|uniref:DJ-1/PfpI family protein n=1 Tax=Parasphingopyxis sp. TaxID=1920299 RepID=UPI00260D769A|nr:DJ-1/PfpI family protein [Parasphingopyxis sp.]